MKKVLSCSLAFFLSLAIMAAFTPLTGAAFAASKLKAPKVTVTATTDTTVSLSWGKVKNAKTYVISKKNEKGELETIATQKTRKLTVDGLTAGETYDFTVAACKKASGAGSGKVAKVEASTGIKTDMSKELKEEAEAIYDVSDEGLEVAEEVSYDLAFNPKYASSNEGFRNAGSAAEHKAAYYLADQFEDLGLDVNIDKVNVDKWQFNDARMTVTDENGDEVVDLGTDSVIEDADISIVSYAASGTKQAEAAGTVEEGTYEKGLEIVYCGTGSQDDIATYAPDGIEGKIALVGIDPFGTSWITEPYNECIYEGAIGVVSFNIDGGEVDADGNGDYGYARYSKDANHVQDICSSDLGYPCTNISYNNAQKIIKAQEKGSTTAKLYVDNEVKVGGGKTYNVTATLKGTGNTGQRIIYAGHYDKYFYGYEDDCLAVGLVFGIAKSMVEAGYEPENDIVFIAHGAEEWGKSGTSYDWAQGSYQEITSAHPEWQGSTLALFDFECPGIENGYDQIVLSSVEGATVVQNVIDSGVLDNTHGEKTYTASSSNHLALSYADTIGFEQNGVPAYMNYSRNAKTNTTGEASSSWFQNRYHTQYDTVNEDAPTKGTLKDDGQYSSELMQQQIDTWAAFGVSYDKTPALVLDFQARIDMLYDAMFDENGNNTTVASKKQAKAYKTALNKLTKAAAKSKAEGEQINADYAEALAAGDTVAEAKLETAALKYNKKVLKAFRAIQDNLISMDIGDYSSEISHTFLQEDYDILTKAVNKLSEDKSTESGEEAMTTQYYTLWALDFDSSAGYIGTTYMDSWLDYTYGVSSSLGNLDNMRAIFTNCDNTWGKAVQKVNGLEDEWKTTKAMYLSEYYSKYYPSLFKTSSSLATSYAKFAKTAKSLTIKYIQKETKSMGKIANML